MKIFETVYKLSGKIDSTFPSAFGSASKRLEDINKRILELNKINKNVENFKILKNELKELEESYKDVQGQTNKFASEIKKSENAIGLLKKQYEFAVENLKKLESQMLETANTSKELQNKLKQAKEEVKKLSAELSQTENPSKELKDKLRQAKDEVKKLSDELEKVNNPSEEFQNKLKQAKEEVKNLSKEIKQSEKTLKGLQTGFDKTKEKSSKLKEKIEQKNERLKQLREALQNAGISTLNFAKDTSKLNRELDKNIYIQKRLIEYQKRVEQARSKRQNARAEMLSALETAMILQQPIAQAIKFESAMADVRKVVDFQSPQQFKQMGKDILELSKRIPMTAEGLAAIVASGGQAGLAREELLKYAESAAKMGVAFDISAEQAGQMMAQWRAAFRMNQNQVTTLADQINYLGNTTAASAPKISEVVTRVGPLGRIGGTAAGQIAALGASMVSAGINEEIAATGIKNLILGLTAGSAATKTQQQAFKMLGLDAVNMAKFMQKDAKGAILTVFEALQKLPKEKQAAVLTDLFGKESIGAIAPLLTNLNGLKDNFNKVGNSALYAGSMQKEFEARSDTTENKLILLKNTLNSLAGSFGSMLLPPLKELSNIAINAASVVQNLSDRFPNLTKVISIGVASVLGFGIAFKTLSYVGSIVAAPFIQFNALMIRFGLISKDVTWAMRAQAAAQKVLNLVMSANPVVRVIMVLMALGTALVVLYQKNEKFRNIVNSVGNTLKNVAETGINYFIDKINVLIGLLNKVKVPSWVPLIGGKGFNIKQISRVDFGDMKIGKNATGTNNWRGGWTIVGERGPELVNLPGGSTIYNNTKTRNLFNKALGLSGINDNLSFVINQSISIGGGSNMDTNRIKTVVRDAVMEVMPDIREELRRIKQNERRLAFAD